jgi:hypothetical protein
MRIWHLALLVWVLILPLCVMALTAAGRFYARWRRSRPALVGYTPVGREVGHESTKITKD